jgi:hypothetical protein
VLNNPISYFTTSNISSPSASHNAISNQATTSSGTTDAPSILPTPDASTTATSTAQQRKGVLAERL